ncbi:hypothetical protein P4E94_12400 [Pontiellaceae bacterium B12219]|nr:hypothetical protein [Pontiellaceae bacterium B12219]
MSNKKMEMKAIFNDYQYAKSHVAKRVHVQRGREIMRPSLIPFALEIYATGNDIEFAEAMIASCDSDKATAMLWDIAQAEDTDPLIRTICMAHLLNRDQLWVWGQITDEDIETICGAMPAHVVHWKHILIKYSGKTHRYFKNDTYPERHKFRALFRECIETYEQKEEYRELLNIQHSSRTTPAETINPIPLRPAYA